MGWTHARREANSVGCRFNNYETVVNELALVADWSSLTDSRLKDKIVDNFTTAKVWVSNVLNGTVIRINLDINPAVTPPITVSSITTVATGYAFINTMEGGSHCLVAGPEGIRTAGLIRLKV